MVAGHRMMIIALGATLFSACMDVDFVRRMVSSEGPPVVLEVVRGNDQAGVAGATLPGALVVRLADASNRSVSGRPVSFRVRAGGGTLATPTVVTDRRGLAATLWTPGPVAAEPQVVEAILVVPETGVGLVARFEAGIVPGEPAVALRHGAGPGAAGVAGLQALEIEVRDRFANPVPGVPVEWRVEAGDGSVTAEATGTDAMGVARARWTVGAGASGLQRVVARPPGIEPVVFEHRAVPLVTALGEDFERGLESWTGRGLGWHGGVIVADPLDPSNRVLTFTRGASGGDVFSAEIVVDPDAEYEISFDYLGLARPGSAFSNHGGFIGISEGLPGSHAWIAGTDPPHTSNDLVDDGAWHGYAFRFRPSSYLPPRAGRIRVMLEDASAPGRIPGVVGDAYFDNVRLRRISR